MKRVSELSQKELEELRGRYYHKSLDDGSLEEVMGKEIESEEEVPMDLVKAHYSDTFFVPEDFFCNLEKKGKILASDFIEYYFSDSSDHKIIGEQVAHILKSTGYYNMTVERLFLEQEAIPGHICHELLDPEDEDNDLVPETLEFIDDISEVHNCYKCDKEYRGEFKFCSGCQTSLA